MPSRSRTPGQRLRAGHLAILLVLVWATIAIFPGVATAAKDPAPRGLGEFLWGLAGQESGWDYYARNTSSGAFGRYQVMPDNWPSWADRYLGDRAADQTPLNQELVVRAKVADLHHWLGAWRRVAYWWLTGDTETRADHWSKTARRYVANVLSLMSRSPEGGSPLPPAPSDRSLPVERGDWRIAAGTSRLFASMGRADTALTTVRDNTVLLVRRSAWGDGGHVLWLRVETADGRSGWLSTRRTLPARRPPNADAWPDNGKGNGGGGDPPPDSRERARPRPR